MQFEFTREKNRFHRFYSWTIWWGRAKSSGGQKVTVETPYHCSKWLALLFAWRKWLSTRRAYGPLVGQGNAGQRHIFSFETGINLTFSWCPKMPESWWKKIRLRGKTRMFDYDLGCRPPEGFWITTYPISESVWNYVMGISSDSPSGPDTPIKGVNYDACSKFCENLSGIVNEADTSASWHFNLPYEGEWEFAARAGATADSFGSNPSTINSRCAEFIEINPSVYPCDIKKTNAWGLCGTGGLWEWCHWFSISEWKGHDPPSHFYFVARCMDEWSTMRKWGCCFKVTPDIGLRVLGRCKASQA